MTTEEYFYLEHYLEHYSIIFYNNKMSTLVDEIIDYISYLFRSTDSIPFEEGIKKLKYCYKKAQRFDYWSKPTFKIDKPIPFA